MNKTTLLSAAMLALGVLLAGFSIGSGIREYASKDQSVSVKGLSTRDVMSDHVVWPMSYALHGQSIPALYSEISQLQEVVIAFLIEQGFEASDITPGTVSVSDNWSSYYGTRPEYHYTISASVVISTDKVDLVRNNQNCASKLLAHGIILSAEEWNVDYQYNGLSQLKPEMIEEATKNARAVAQKFADDANCRLRGIRHASQGQFTVEADDNCPWIKHVRVVTTVDYFLR